MRRASILVVDDEPRLRYLVKQAFVDEQFYVNTTEGGYDALAELKRRAYDLMLLDLRMPDVDGMTVMRQAWLIRPEMNVVVMTAHGTVDDAVEAMKLGAADFL